MLRPYSNARMSMKKNRSIRYRVAAPPEEKPLMVYDGDCNFCRRWITRWQVITGDRVDYAPFQEVACQFSEVPKEVFEEAVQFVEPNGDVHGGAEAVFHSLTYAPSKRWTLWTYERVPGVAPITEWLYRFVARHRMVFSVITRTLWGRNVTPPR